MYFKISFFFFCWNELIAKELKMRLPNAKSFEKQECLNMPLLNLKEYVPILLKNHLSIAAKICLY